MLHAPTRQAVAVLLALVQETALSRLAFRHGAVRAGIEQDLRQRFFHLHVGENDNFDFGHPGISCHILPDFVRTVGRDLAALFTT